ncbi:MAG: chloride channel protein, partial [Promethearchaeota archaeon]
IFYPNNPELFVILGISAVLGSATNNPIAAIAIIIEMTWIPELFIPAGITTIITYIFSGPNSIIPGQRSVKFQLI